MKNKLTYKEYVYKLEWTKSVSELRQYVTGEKKLSKAMSPVEQKKLITKVIPCLIAKNTALNEKNAPYWGNLAFFRVAMTYCLNKNLPKAEIFLVADEMLNRIMKDDTNIAVQKRMTEYAKRNLDAYGL